MANFGVSFDPLGFIGGLIGGFQERKTAQETNLMNYKINQMNNSFNEEQARLARNFQYHMWNETNEYNSASNQRKRLEEAGMNPYMMMNGGSAGTATSVGGPSASASPPIAMQPYSSPWSRLSGANLNPISLVSDLVSLKKAKNDLKKSDVETSVWQDYVNGMLERLKLSNKGQKEQNRISKVQADVSEQTAIDQVNTIHYQAEIAKQEAGLIETQKLLAKENLKWLPLEKIVQLGQAIGNLQLLYSQKKINEKQLEVMAQNVAESVARTKLYNAQVDNTNADTSLKHSQQAYYMELGASESVKRENMKVDGQVAQIKKEIIDSTKDFEINFSKYKSLDMNQKYINDQYMGNILWAKQFGQVADSVGSIISLGLF